MKKIALNIFLGAVFASFAFSAYAAQWETKSMAGFSEVNLYIPDSDSPIGSGKSLMIVLHGCGHAASSFTTANLDASADEYGMVMAAPFATEIGMVVGNPLNCWLYWDGIPTRTGKDYVKLLDLVDEIKAITNIDSDQVYIAGVSSGGAFAMELGCLAPDVFAGMGITAGPSPGTGMGGSMGGFETPVAGVAAECKSYAGANNLEFFETQIFNGAAGTDTTGNFTGTDGLVNRAYVPQNAEGMAEIYGVSATGEKNTITINNRTAIETIYEDGRVTQLALVGLGHAWSGGEGAGGSTWVGSQSINYASYLAKFFSENNLRVNRDEENTAPEIDSFSVTADENALIMSGSVSDEEDSNGDLDASIKVTQGSTVISEFEVALAADGSFSDSSITGLDNATYSVKLTVEDSEGEQATQTKTAVVYVEPEPENVAPVVTQISAESSGDDCIIVSGSANDTDGVVTSVKVRVSGLATEEAIVNGNSFEYQVCDLPPGTYSVYAVAEDNDGDESDRSETVTVKISVPVVDGDDDGDDDGSADGSDDGSADGSDDGSADGSDDGSADGSDDGSADGSDDGSADGDDDVIIVEPIEPPSVGGGSTGVPLLLGLIMLGAVVRRRR